MKYFLLGIFITVALIAISLAVFTRTKSEAGSGFTPGVDCVDFDADLAPPLPDGSPGGDCRFNIADTGYLMACIKKYGAAVPVSGEVKCIDITSSPTHTATASATATETETPTLTSTNTATITNTPTASFTPTYTNTNTPTITPIPPTNTATFTPTPSPTNTPIPPTPTPNPNLPAGFIETTIATGIASGTSMTMAPDGRIFLTQQSGALRIVKNGVLLPTPFVTLTVDSAGERGLLGVAVDPDFATNRFVYVYYTTTSGGTHNRVSRFTANSSNLDVAAAGSEVILLELNALSTATNHNGGALHFGPDGKLYIAVGENANGANAQSMSNLLGKILRMNKDGSIPTDNPFYSTATGNNRLIWALGLRNPFTFNFQPGTGRIFINDVGEGAWEEINDGIAGSNYGWPATEGETSNPAYRSPLLAYGHGTGSSTGCSIVGAAFYNPTTLQFPTSYIDKYFYGDFCSGWIRTYNPSTDSSAAFATGISFPVDLLVSPDGSLYYLYRGGGGGLKRITYSNPPTPTNTPTPTPTSPSVTRDKFLQPFASNSIWNMPIGSNANYVNTIIDIQDGFGVENALVIMSPSSPLRSLYDNNSWWPGTACNASGPSQLVPIPDNFIVPAPPSGGDGTLPNRPGGVLKSNGTDIVEFQYATRCNATGPLTAGDASRCTHSIYGSGQCSYGAQGGSGLSGVGGVLRLWEINATIKHALKITLPAESLSNCNSGFRWPAIAADGYWQQYSGSVCDLRMGSLVALHPTYNCGQFSGLANRICQALKDYGAYVGDTHPPGWNPTSIIGEWGTNTQLSSIGGSIATMTEALDVISNNTSSSVGGGGTPRVPLAPPIGN